GSGCGLLRRSDSVVAGGRAESDCCCRAGVRDNRIALIPPAVESFSPPLPRSPAPLLLGIGPLERHKGFRDALWTVDILRYLYDDLRLVLVGTGSDEGRLRRFGRVAGTPGRVGV